MGAVLPGKPQSRPQALTLTRWNGINISAYISGSAFTILDGARTILQTIYGERDEQLEAISIDEWSGKIAVCSSTEIRIYQPFGRLQDHSLKWILESSLGVATRQRARQIVLSWGSFEELLIAGSSLSLIDTKGRPVCLWHAELPNPVKLASLSYESAYVASIGYHDQLVKIWRRLTYGPGDIRFDLSYIQHANIVLDIRWCRPFKFEHSAGNVLYTLCTDACLRVWTASDTNYPLQWKLWGMIDVGKSLRSIDLLQDPWLACFIDGRDFAASVQKSMEQRMTHDQSTDGVVLDRLVAIAEKNPEIYIAFNFRGSMSAWALDLSKDTGENSRIFRIAEIISQRCDTLDGFLPLDVPSHVEMQAYYNQADGQFYFLLHSFDGRIGVFTNGVSKLFNPAINNKLLSLKAVWSGHSASIEKINRNSSGRAVVSRTSNGETIVWKQVFEKSRRSTSTTTSGLFRRCVIPEEGRICRTCLLRQGRFVVFLREKTVSLWDCRSSRGKALAHCPYRVTGKPLCLIVLPRPHDTGVTTAHIATITSEQEGIVWEVTFPRFFEVPAATEGARVREFCRFELEAVKGLKQCLPVDPAGPVAVTSGFFDVFSRDIALSYTRTGRVDLWTARVDLYHSTVHWLSTSYTDTGISEPSLASGSTLKKVALVNCARSQLTIWDVGGARLEFEENFKPQNCIQDLDWTSTPDAQSILAVGFQYRVILLCQMRFDYLNKGPAWAPIRTISIREMTPHPIGDSTWLSDGHLLIGAGNQLLIYDRTSIHTDSTMTDPLLPHGKTGTWDLFATAQHFNGPLPVFHPQFLSQCMLAGKTSLVIRILVELYKTLKDLSPGESVDNYLGFDLTAFYASERKMRPAFRVQLHGGSFIQDYRADDQDIFTEEIAAFVSDRLMKIRIPQLSGQHQIQLVDIIECMALVERQRRSMDDNGARFMLFFRQHALRKGRSNRIKLSWREINWAFHSKSQDVLLDFVSHQNHGNIFWEHARESGIFAWLTDDQTFRNYFEVIARNEYTKGKMKDPVDCSLYYIALGKKTVLQGLWRMANWHKEQVATQRLLANNFNEPKWRKAALKNAYALLSKRRFEYAAAFFLLASDLKAAVEICLRHLNDLQLAIAIARVYEGGIGPVLKKLLEEEILRIAAREGNRWLASWAFWMLDRKDMAVRALVTPVYNLMETTCAQDLCARLYLTDDPALIVLYSQLRQQTLQTLKGALEVSSKVEWEFVLQSAKVYDRMGCDLLALDLVRNWDFQSIGMARSHRDMSTLLEASRDPLVVDDVFKPELDVVIAKPSAQVKQSQKMTENTFRVDAESLLGSFGL